MKIMNITSIREVGSNGILKLAIVNNSNIKDDKEVIDLINQETSYMITIENVNMLELFRLTQTFGPDIRIISTNDVSTTPEEMNHIYPGTAKTEDGSEFNISEAVSYTTDMFIGLTKQMYTDNDIIKDNVADMYVPMMLRTYTIELPLRFDDLIIAMDDITITNVFNENYPKTLTGLRDGCHTFNDIIMKLPLLTDMVSYPDRYDQLLNAIYYNQLKHSILDIGKIGLCSISRLDPSNRSNVVLSLYNNTTEGIRSQLEDMSKLNTPLEFKFIIKLPIQYMQILENSYRPELLQGCHRSSVQQIISDGIDLDKLPSGYKTRVTECVEKVHAMIGILISNEPINTNASAIYSVLPSIYSTNMMVTFKYDMKSEYLQHPDPVIKELWDMAIKLADGFISDMNTLKK